MVPAPSAAQLEPLRRVEALDKGEAGAVRGLMAPATPSHPSLGLWLQGDFGLGPLAGGGKLRADLAGLGQAGAAAGQGDLTLNFCALAGQAPASGAARLDPQGRWRPASAPAPLGSPKGAPQLTPLQPALAFSKLPALAGGRPGQPPAGWRLSWTWEVERPARQAPSLADLATPGPGGRP